MAHWLIKSEPNAYSFDQLVRDRTTSWTGVRNYAARNNLRAMKTGDLALFYHSNLGKAVVGIAQVVREAYADTTGEGDWSAVDVAPVKALRDVTLDAMRAHPSLNDMVLWKQGRLSVVPVTKSEFDAIVRAGEGAPPPTKKASKKTSPKKRPVAKKASKKVATR